MSNFEFQNKIIKLYFLSNMDIYCFYNFIKYILNFKDNNSENLKYIEFDLFIYCDNNNEDDLFISSIELLIKKYQSLNEIYINLSFNHSKHLIKKYNQIQDCLFKFKYKINERCKFTANDFIKNNKSCFNKNINILIRCL